MAKVEMEKQTFLKFTYHGVDLDQLLMIHCTTQHSLLKCLRKTEKEVSLMEKPMVLKTHLRNRIIPPEMAETWWACITARPSTRWKSNQR
ncbi:hypothetical protein U0070_020038 [Myodes glareolus]|uniref:40S ribosomal protein S15 n=1 Tax=Myodes glareolus TaxID=447135 RepID=A0AAW0HC58_MYOGA